MAKRKVRAEVALPSRFWQFYERFKASTDTGEADRLRAQFQEKMGAKRAELTAQLRGRLGAAGMLGGGVEQQLLTQKVEAPLAEAEMAMEERITERATAQEEANKQRAMQLSMTAYQEDIRREQEEAAKKAQMAGAIGSLIGTAVGAVAGTAIPGVGNVAGAALGASIGGKAGGWVGQALTSAGNLEDPQAKEDAYLKLLMDIDADKNLPDVPEILPYLEDIRIPEYETVPDSYWDAG